MKKKWLRWVSLGAVCCPQFLGATPVTGTWTPTTGGTIAWNTPADWSTNPTVPGLTGNNGDTATFPAQSASADITIAATTTLQALTVANATAAPFTFSSAGGAFVFENLSPTTLPSIITITGSGTATISANLTSGSTAQPLNFTLATGTTLTISGVIGVGGGGGIAQAGAGSLILTNTNTYTDPTTISGGGTLFLSGSGSIADSSSVMVSSGTFDISATNSSTSITGLAGAGDVNLGAKVLTLTGSTNQTFSGVISSTSATGGLTQSGSLTQTLAGANTYTGPTAVNAGTLAAGAIGSFAPSSNFTVASGATLDLADFNQTIGSLSGSGTVSLGSAILTTGNVNDTTFAGTISGTTGGLTYVGSATFFLTAACSYSGPTVINNGLLLTSVADVLASSSAFTVNTNGILQLEGTNQTIGSLAGAGTVNLAGGVLTISSNGGSAIFSGKLNGAAAGSGLILSGSLTQTLAGINNYIGPTNITGSGTLALSGSGSIVASSVVAVGSSGTFDISATTSGASIISLSGSGGVKLLTTTLTITGLTNNIFSGVVGLSGGSGGLTLSGAATQTLSGTSLYTGATTIGSGTLYIAGSGSIASSVVNLTTTSGTFDISGTTSGTSIAGLNGITGTTVNLGTQVLTLTGATNQTYAGAISGAGGGFTYSGTAIQTLSGTNSYTGATVVSGGTLALTGSTTIADSSSLTVTSPGIFDVSHTTAGATIKSLLGNGHVAAGGSSQTLILEGGTWSGVIADGGISGGVAANVTATAGTLTVSGVNTFIGTALIEGGGIVTVSPGGQWGGTTATLQLGSGVTNGTITYNTTVTLPNNLAITTGSTGFFNVGTGQVVTLTGSLNDGGAFITGGAGQLLLNGPTGTYTGDMTITSGTVNINTSLLGATVTVSGGTLKGTGSIEHVVVDSGGTLAPGNSIGTITMTNLTFTTGSIYNVEVSPAGASNTVVTGATTFPATPVPLVLTVDPGSYGSNINDLVFSSANGVPVGAFSLSNPSLLISTQLLYDGNDVFLMIDPLPFSTLSGNFVFNARAVADYLDASAPITPGTDFYDVVAVLKSTSDPAQLQADLLELQPSHLKGLALAQQSDSMQVNQAFYLRAQSLYRAACIRDSDKKKTLTLWGDAWGDFVHQEHYQGEVGFHVNTGGALLGLDYAVWKNLYLGLATAYTYSKVDWNKSVGDGTVQSFYGLFYGTWFSSNFFVNAALMGAYNHYAEKRHIVLSTPVLSGISINRHASADFGGGEVGGYLNTGALFKAVGLEFSPFAALEYYYLHQGSFTEAGAQSIDLKVKSSNTDLLRASLGLGIAKCYVWAKTKWIPLVQVAVVREERFGGRNFRATMKGNESIYFTVHGMNPSRTLVAPVLGFTTWSCNDHCSVSLFYSGEFNANYQDQQVNLQIGYGF